MKELDILRKEIGERIEQLKKEKNIDNTKRAILIKENTKFLVRVQQLGLPYLGKSLPMEREQDNADNFDRFDYLRGQ